MSAEELRQQERIPRPIMVRYLHPDTSPPKWSLVPARDFSRTGVRFYSEYPFTMGDGVTLHLLLPMAREPVRLMGRVAWKRPETALGVVEIGVEHSLEPASLEHRGQRLGLGARSKDLELHEEAPLERLLVGAALGDVHPGLVSLAVRGSAHLPSLATAGMHFEVGLGAELGDLDQGHALRDGQPLLGTPVPPALPCRADQRGHILP